LIGEFSSKLASKVFASGGEGTKEKTMKTCWNKSFLGSRARMLTPNP
jgi:hypothetical protein